MDIPRFQELLGNGSQFGINLSYKVQPSPDGLVQAFILGEEFIGDEPCTIFFMVENSEKSHEEAVKKSHEEAVKIQRKVLSSEEKPENLYLKELRRLHLEEENLLKKQRESSAVSEENSN